MAYPQHLIQRRFGTSLIYPIIFLWGLGAIALVTILGSSAGFGDDTSRFYLVPWCFATGAVVIAPSVYLVYKRRFNPFHPLVFPVWSYFFPGFFIGGLALAAGLSQPYFLTFVQDEYYNLPLTFVYIMVGYAGLVAGFSIPFARSVGVRVGNWLPQWKMADAEIAVPGLVLLALGLATTILAFIQGILGYQKIEEVGVYDGIVFLLSLFWLEATFLLWLYIFRSRTISVKNILIIGVLLFTSLTKSAFQGNRGSLVQMLIVISFAYVFAGRKLGFRQYALGSVLVVAALIVGMIYGTTFRSVKQTQERVAIGEYAGLVGEALGKISDQDLGTTVATGLGSLAERLDNVSSLAVVVSNYEALAPYEEIWGINNNIYGDTVTFFVPRVIWPDKPVAIEAQKYADLYFNFSENSFTMTPMGDLLRNFGPAGVPLGMLALGFLIRVIYAALIEDREFSVWRAAVFYMMLTSVSYEGTYGLILPLLVKIGLTAFAGMTIVRVIQISLSGFRPKISASA